MAQLRTVLMFIITGAFLAMLAVSFAGPRILEWYNTPLAASATCLCSEVARQASTIISYQLRGSAVGAVLGLILGIAFVVMRRKKPEPAAK